MAEQELMDEPKDKRTKAWKDWKQNFDKENTKGLGDVIESVTKNTGIDKIVKFVAGEDCGCEDRKKKANKIRLRFKQVRCFTEDQFNGWTEFRELNTNEVTYKQQTELIIPIYAQLFARSLKPLSCCAGDYVKEINRIYELYL